MVVAAPGVIGGRQGFGRGLQGQVGVALQPARVVHLTAAKRSLAHRRVLLRLYHLKSVSNDASESVQTMLTPLRQVVARD